MRRHYLSCRYTQCLTLLYLCRWLYTLFLAIDANFKLKSKSRQLNEFELGPGWSYFVASAPYQKHLASFVGEPEVRRTCSHLHVFLIDRNL